MNPLTRTALLFLLTAVAEIAGCYFPYLWLREGGGAWLLLPAAACLAAFAWLLTLQPFAAGRTYAAYGGVYVCAALLWLWIVEGQRPGLLDLAGALLCLLGMSLIALGPRSATAERPRRARPGMTSRPSGRDRRGPRER